MIFWFFGENDKNISACGSTPARPGPQRRARTRTYWTLRHIGTQMARKKRPIYRENNHSIALIALEAFLLQKEWNDGDLIGDTKIWS